MKTFTVSELTTAIKNLLEPNFRGISLQGEISNFKLQSSGHLYFSLKDAGSQISAVMFRGSAGNLSRMPKEGDQVVAKGELSLYMPRGSYQIVIREMQFSGQGELLIKLHQLKDAIHARGWFNKDLKKPLPKFPKKIGVVTSPTGAVIQDILNVLNRRFSGFHLILNPVKVQGPGSALEIAKAIKDFNTHTLVDVMIVGRGGGSIEDLWAFNEEIVAKAIHESKIPIVAAIGHETDVTIADFVADVRAPTPSAAAEMVVAEKTNILKFLKDTGEYLHKRMIYQLHQSRQHLEALKRHPLLGSPQNLLMQPILQLDNFRDDFKVGINRLMDMKKQSLKHSGERLSLLNPLTQVRGLQEKLKPYRERYGNLMTSSIREKRNSLVNLKEHLHSLNPKNLLKKGYSLLQTEEGKVIASVRAVQKNKPLNILLHDGKVSATPNEVEYDSK